MLKYFLKLTVLLTLLGWLFRSFYIFQFQGDLLPLLQAWVWGLQFDVAIGSAIALLGTLISGIALAFKKQKWPFFIGFFLFTLTLLVLIGDALFFLESGRHVTYEAKSFFISFFEITSTGFKSLSLLFVFAPIFLPLSAWRFLPRWNSPIFFSKRTLLEILCMLLVTVASMRGFYRVPQNPSFAYKLGDARGAVIAMNGAYGFFYGLLNSSKIRRTPVALPEGISVQNIVDNYVQKTQRSERPLVKANVIYILLEGWPARILQSYGGEKNVTPFFESLRKKSITTDLTFAGGLRTTESIFANFCSWMNPLGQSIAKSSLESQNYICLPHLLRENGWSSSFFQGTTKETSGTGELAQKVGFMRSYGKYDVPNFAQLPKNAWGLFDRDIYGFALDKSKELSEPFILGINSNSTHSLELPPGDPATFGCDNPDSCFYSLFASADRDLEQFFNEYQKLPHKLPTIWVMVADHTTKQKSRIDLFRVPMLIYAPDFVNLSELPKVSVSTQRDVGITLAHILGLNTKNMLGRSLLDAQAPARADYFHQGVLGWVMEDRLYELSVESAEVVGCYNWRTDTAQMDNLLNKDEQCSQQLKEAQAEALAIVSWCQEKLFSGAIGK